MRDERHTVGLLQHPLLVSRRWRPPKPHSHKRRQNLCLRSIPRRPPRIPRLLQLVRPEPPSGRMLIEQLNLLPHKHPSLPILLSRRHMPYRLRVDRRREFRHHQLPIRLCALMRQHTLKLVPQFRSVLLPIQRVICRSEGSV
jgi:hypothetical protein